MSNIKTPSIRWEQVVKNGFKSHFFNSSCGQIVAFAFTDDQITKFRNSTKDNFRLELGLKSQSRPPTGEANFCLMLVVDNLILDPVQITNESSQVVTPEFVEEAVQAWEEKVNGNDSTFWNLFQSTDGLLTHYEFRDDRNKLTRDLFKEILTHDIEAIEIYLGVKDISCKEKYPYDIHFIWGFKLSENVNADEVLSKLIRIQDDHGVQPNGCSTVSPDTLEDNTVFCQYIRPCPKCDEGN